MDDDGKQRDGSDYGIVASINPGDVYVEGDSLLQNLGRERMERLLPFRSYLEGGVRMASGSDYYVAPWDPWIGIHAMRTRALQVSGDVVGADQTIPLQEALATYTIHGAYLTYDDDVRGSIEVGKLADLVVVEADLLAASERDLLAMGDRVLLTMVGGSRRVPPGRVVAAGGDPINGARTGECVRVRSRGLANYSIP